MTSEYTLAGVISAVLAGCGVLSAMLVQGLGISTYRPQNYGWDHTAGTTPERTTSLIAGVTLRSRSGATSSPMETRRLAGFRTIPRFFKTSLYFGFERVTW
jgi:hypothetical protein